MRHLGLLRRRKVAVAAVFVLGAGLLAGGGVVATNALGQPSVDARVNALLAKMTTDEKLEQMQLLADWQATPAEAQKGVGGVFSQTNPATINALRTRQSSIPGCTSRSCSPSTR